MTFVDVNEVVGLFKAVAHIRADLIFILVPSVVSDHILGGNDTALQELGVSVSFVLDVIVLNMRSIVPDGDISLSAVSSYIPQRIIMKAFLIIDFFMGIYAILQLGEKRFTLFRGY